MIVQTVMSAGSTALLRRTLQVNSVMVGLLSLVFIMDAPALAAWTGLERWIIWEAGLIFLPYALVVWFLAGRDGTLRQVGWFDTVLALVWAIGSVAILLSGRPPLTVAGQWAVGILADLVATFAGVQLYALLRK